MVSTGIALVQYNNQGTDLGIDKVPHLVQISPLLHVLSPVCLCMCVYAILSHVHSFYFMVL